MPKPVALSQPVTTIGRASGNDIALPHDPTVSRQHAVIQREAGALVIIDHGSTSGTFVNKKRVSRQVLQERDQFRLGNSLFDWRGGQLWVPDQAVVAAERRRRRGVAAAPVGCSPLPVLIGVLAGAWVLAVLVLLVVYPSRSPSVSGNPGSPVLRPGSLPGALATRLEAIVAAESPAPTPEATTSSGATTTATPTRALPRRQATSPATVPPPSATSLPPTATAPPTGKPSPRPTEEPQPTDTTAAQPSATAGRTAGATDTPKPMETVTLPPPKETPVATFASGG